MMKPEPAIFEYLLGRYGLSPNDTVFVDDSPPNIDAARSLGLKTVWFRDARQCKVELDEFLGAG
jgi:HAD superfamily hydrolase (TIGR01509 family)